MSQAEELLNSMSTDDTAGTEPHIVIRDDRVIVVPDELKRIAVQFDNNIETVTFDCPRYWDDHDMSTMTVYVNYMRADGKSGSYKAKNVRIDESDDTIMHFDWTITRNVSEVKGQLAILVCVKSVDDEGNEQTHWNSELCKTMSVSEGLDCGESVVEQYPDIITQILTELGTKDVIKEIVVESIQVPKIFVQDLEKGIYTFKSLWTGVSPQRISLISGATALGTCGVGSILIVNNDSTIKNTTKTFNKAFVLIQSGLTDGTATYVKCGTLKCIATTEEDGTITWAYECNSGNILTQADRTTTINDDTDILDIPTVGAVVAYVENYNNIQFETIAEYTIESEEAVIYYLSNFSDNTALWLNAFYIEAKIPTTNDITPILEIEVGLGDKNTASYTGYFIKQHIGETVENETEILKVKFDINNSVCDLYSSLKNVHSEFRLASNHYPIDTERYKGVRNIALRAVGGTKYPVGTTIKVLGVRK